MNEEIEVIAARIVEHAKRLAQVGVMQGEGVETTRDGEVRKIALRSSELVRGAATLGRERNAVALGVVFRTVIESMILLLWVEVSEENAKHQEGAGLAEFARITKINIQEKYLKVKIVDTGEDGGSDLLKSEIFQDLKKSKNVEMMAKEAGVSFLYNVLYRFGSLSTHGHSMDEDISDNEKIIVELQAVASMSVAIGHVAVRWLINRERTDNETLGKLFGFDDR